MDAGEAGRLDGVGAVIGDAFGHRRCHVFARARAKVLLAMAGGDVDDAGAGVVGHVVAIQQRRFVGVGALVAAQR